MTINDFIKRVRVMLSRLELPSKQTKKPVGTLNDFFNANPGIEALVDARTPREVDAARRLLEDPPAGTVTSRVRESPTLADAARMSLNFDPTHTVTMQVYVDTSILVDDRTLARRIVHSVRALIGRALRRTARLLRRG